MDIIIPRHGVTSYLSEQSKIGGKSDSTVNVTNESGY